MLQLTPLRSHLEHRARRPVTSHLTFFIRQASQASGDCGCLSFRFNGRCSSIWMLVGFARSMFTSENPLVHWSCPALIHLGSMQTSGPQAFIGRYAARSLVSVVGSLASEAWTASDSPVFSSDRRNPWLSFGIHIRKRESPLFLPYIRQSLVPASTSRSFFQSMLESSRILRLSGKDVARSVVFFSQPSRRKPRLRSVLWLTIAYESSPNIGSRLFVLNVREDSILSVCGRRIEPCSLNWSKASIAEY